MSLIESHTSDKYHKVVDRISLPCPLSPPPPYLRQAPHASHEAAELPNQYVHPHIGGIRAVLGISVDERGRASGRVRRCGLRQVVSTGR